LVDTRQLAGLPSATQDEEATEEDVAEIFVRINNQGTRLGQADFVLTLLSVYHGELRDRLEERSRAMSSGAVIAIDTQQLLRAACGVAFGRARMSAVYRYLRGVDPTTGETDTAGRLQRLGQLDAAANECMEAIHWRDFLLPLANSGLGFVDDWWSSEVWYQDWIQAISTTETTSQRTSDSLTEARKIVVHRFDSKPVTLYSVSSANHAPRVLRDELIAFEYGTRFRSPQNVTLCAVAAETCYGGGTIQEVQVDDLGKHSVRNQRLAND
jgi:hypothetical protein